MSVCNEDCNWEDIYDSGQLDEQLENFDSDQLQPIGVTGESGESDELGVHKTSDKQIKILKRSESSKDGEVERCHPENRSLIEQSVAQREKDYAVARERIMGTKQSNKAPDSRRRDRPRRNGGNNQKQPG